MPSVDVVVETEISTSVRARQVSAMFDVPPESRARLAWHLDLGMDQRPWQIGLVVGPSGSGKSTLMKHLWGEQGRLTWNAKSVVDDFSPSLSVQQIAEACSAVGFNTIPAWLRPHSVLSNGERFRVEMARLMLEAPPGVVVVDEFTSLVDRQVAKVASHAVQKYVRKGVRQFVAVTCHYDVMEWLQPDWVVDMADASFRWRSVQRRPELECEIHRVPHAEWRIFAPFHYLTRQLHRGARCFELRAAGSRAAFAGILHMPHPKVRDIMVTSRLVTLPDWQGLGLMFALVDRLGGAYRAIGKRLRAYPSHPSFVRSFVRSSEWRLVKAPGIAGRTSHSSGTSGFSNKTHNFGERPAAVFEFAGAALTSADASKLLAL